MSSQPLSPAASLDDSHNNNNNNAKEQGQSSSPQSKADSAVHIDDDSEDKADLDSSFVSTNTESERHPKGKRKRTAAKDKAILEASYNANPKPDKTARLDIVNRVSLNEKEVQIWFQNRRQNDRRKSRPLSSQEIAALRYGGMQVLSSDHVPYNNPPSSASYGRDASPVQAEALPEAETNASSAFAPKIDHGSRESSEHSAVEVEANRVEQDLVASETPLSQDREPASAQLSQTFPRSARYRSLFPVPSCSSRQLTDDTFHMPSSTGAASVLPPPHPSQVRLNISLEGKAKLVPIQPEPPRLSPPASSDGSPLSFPRGSLQRSHSAAPAITLPPFSALTSSLQPHIQHQPQPCYPPHLYRGRSLDVHAWEFACDPDSMRWRDDELTAQAERESSGSAIAAISLIRSASATSLPSAHNSIGNALALQNNNSKRNARPNQANHHDPKRTKLGRASSSVGRLQTSFAHPATLMQRTDGKDVVDVDVVEPSKKAKVSMLASPGENDSDIENWSPDEYGNPVPPRVMGGRRRPLPSAPAPKTMSGDVQSLNSRRSTMGRPVLGDNTLSGRNRNRNRNRGGGPPFPSPMGRYNIAPVNSRRRKAAAAEPVEIFEDGSENDDDKDSKVQDDMVERFMRGDFSPSKKGDVDCVAGLLALSQGNWR